MQFLFSRIDKDGNGSISSEELQQALTNGMVLIWVKSRVDL